MSLRVGRVSYRGVVQSGLGMVIALSAMTWSSSAEGQVDTMENAERAAVAAVEAFYADLVADNAGAAAARAHIDAKQFGVRNDKLMQAPLSLWTQRVAGGFEGPGELDSVLVAGSSATVLYRSVRTGQAVVDHVSLLRFNGAWTIMGVLESPVD